MLDYKLLEALALVVAEGGFDRAARALHLTQSAVSQRVRQLEEAVGRILVVRSTPPEPTEAGRELVAHYLRVRQLEADLDEGLATGLDAARNGDGSVGAGKGGRSRPPTTLPLGVNADTLSFWLLDALDDFLRDENVVLDLTVADQTRTHELLRQGRVAGCVSSRGAAMQGCARHELGRMDYVCVARADKAREWFPQGLSPESLNSAPTVIYNREDVLQQDLFDQVFPGEIFRAHAHYVPDSDVYLDWIMAGHAYGMAPTIQCREQLASGKLTDVSPGTAVRVPLYWHCWNLRTGLLDRLTRALVCGGKRFLEQDGASSPCQPLDSWHKAC